MAPYSYRWDQGLPSGAGPTQVCPGTTTTYTVEATDSSAQSGEFSKTAARSSASVTVTVESPLDCATDSGARDAADAATPDAWSGCETATSSFADPDSGVCFVQDEGGVTTPFDWSVGLSKPLLAGHSYEVTLQVTLVVPTGASQPIDVWGAAGGDCSPNQRLTVQPLPVLPIVGGTGQISFCATAERDDTQFLVGIRQTGNGGTGTSPNGVTAQVCAVTSCGAIDH
jgi:hypothetical protein